MRHNHGARNFFKISYREGLSFGFLIVIIIFSSLIYLFLFLNARIENLRKEREMANDFVISWKELSSFTDRLLVSNIYNNIGLWENTYRNLDFKINLIINPNNNIISKKIEDNNFIKIYKKLKIDKIIELFINKEIINYSDYAPIKKPWKEISDHINIIKNNLQASSLSKIYYSGDLLLNEYGKAKALGTLSDDLKNAVESLLAFSKYSQNFSVKLENTVYVIDNRLKWRITLLNNLMIILSVVMLIIGLFFIYILLKKTKLHAKIESEMKAAAKIQSSVLPRKNEILEGYEISHTTIPATEVGGDNYDFCTTKNGNWISIGDVSGHGLSSGIISLISQAAFNYGTFIFEKVINLKDPQVQMYNFVNKTLVRLNRIRNDNDAFMTQNYFYEKEGTFYCAGAHEIGLLYKKKSNEIIEINELSGRTAYMGLKDDLNPSTSKYEFSMEKGDILLLYTDGLIEAQNEKNEQYDFERLKKIFLKNSNQHVDIIKNNIINDVKLFILHGDLKKHHGSFADDVTLIILKKK